MSRFIIQQNIIRYKALMKETNNKSRLAILGRLLASAESELIAFDAADSYPETDAAVTAFLDMILDRAIHMCEADFGNIQLYDANNNVLRIATQRNFAQPFLDHFAEVGMGDGSACGAALASARQIWIENVEDDAAFAPHLEVARVAGFAAVMSTPLIGGQGNLIGMLSVHFRPHQRISKRFLDSIANFASSTSETIAGRVASLLNTRTGYPDTSI